MASYDSVQEQKAAKLNRNLKYQGLTPINENAASSEDDPETPLNVEIAINMEESSNESPTKAPLNPEQRRALSQMNPLDHIRNRN